MRVFTNILKYYGFILLIQFGLLSCNRYKDMSNNRHAAYEVLKLSSNNRFELEKVFNHYRKAGDSLKLNAAYYLTSNMLEKKSIELINDNPFHAIFPRLKQITYLSNISNPTVSYPRMLIDSVMKNSILLTKIQYDIYNVTAEFLISNIDQSFEQWYQTPWYKNYSFEEFCEWVLPYRVGNEKLENWRAIALSELMENEDSLRQSGDIFALATKLFETHEIHFHKDYGLYPLPMNFSELMELRHGTCDMMGGFGVQLLRSRGIPVAQDIIPGWANRNSTHMWHSLIMPNDKSKDIGYNARGINDISNKVSKIYRKRNSPLKHDLLVRFKDSEIIPPFFAELNLQDVTGDYEMPVTDIKIKKMFPTNFKIAWLCTFDNRDWIPVAYAAVNKNSAKFKNMGRGLLWPTCHNSITNAIDRGDGIVYLPAFNGPTGLVCAANPVILMANGTIREIIPDTSNYEEIKLKRKYPKLDFYHENEKKLVGAQIEGANRQDFEDAEVIFTINAIINPMEEFKVNASKMYRYIRLKTADDVEEIKIAEIAFFSNADLLQGKVIGKIEDPRYDVRSAFDNNLLSYFSTENARTEWVGLDFGKPQLVTSFRLCAYTDDNEIMPGELYELRYWNDGWHIIGQQLAKDYTLTYWAPKEALLWLRNITKGVEERIFTYENEKQIWW